MMPRVIKRPRLKLPDTASILSALERQSVTVSQVRSVLLLDTRGRAVAPHRHGASRLYSVDDIASVRLVLRLRAAGVSPTVARVIVACLRDELSRSWRRPVALAVTGLRGELVSIKAEHPKGIIAWVPLREVWAGIEDTIRALRKAQPEIWQWKPQPLSALTAEAGR